MDRKDWDAIIVVVERLASMAKARLSTAGLEGNFVSWELFTRAHASILPLAPLFHPKYL